MIGVRVARELWEAEDTDAEALLQQWLVAEGQHVTAGQTIAEAVLVKTNVEITAPAAGVLTKILVPVEGTFGPDQDVALIEESVSAAPSTLTPGGGAPTTPEGAPSATAVSISVSAPPRVVAPSVPSMALPPHAAHEALPAGEEREALAAPLAGGTVMERIPLTGPRGAVARNVLASWQSTPRVTETTLVDMSAALDLLERMRRERAEGEPVSINDVLLRAVALTLREHPRLNARLVGEAVEVIADVHLGVAVNLAEGLVVPVLRHADEKSILEIAAETRTLARGARDGSLSTAAYQGGTFTVTNLGSTGVDVFTPIVNSPQVAILGVGAVEPRPLVRNGHLLAAPSVHLSLVFDHRALDGYPAARFLAALKARLQEPRDL